MQLITTLKMNIELIKIIFASSVISALLSSFINGFFSERKTFKDNKYRETKENIPILLEIVEGLSILEQAFIYRGIFCPLIEHRCPTLSQQDGNISDQQMSFAQRGHFFHKIGQKIIKNCRQIVYLTPKKHLPLTLKTCKEIISFLNEKQSPESKARLDYMISILTSALSGQFQKDAYQSSLIYKEFNDFHQILCDLKIQLESEIEKELPYLSDQQCDWKTYTKIAISVCVFIGIMYLLLYY